MAASREEGPVLKTRRKLITFVSAIAQYDNLGDLEIRRAALQWVRGWSDEVHLLIGDAPPDFVAALAPPTALARTYRSRWAFAVAVLRATARGRVCLLLSPGPVVAASTIRAAVGDLANLVQSLLVRAASGHVLAIGRSYRPSRSRIGTRLMVIAARLHTVGCIRDARSSVYVTPSHGIVPDIAVASAESASAERPRAALSFRSDRTPSDALMVALLEWCFTNDLEPVLVTQVARDGDQHARLASRHGIAHSAWSEASYEDQMRRVRTVYSSSRFVFTDRLHAAIIGANEGAFPIVRSDAGDKVTGALRVWAPLVVVPAGGESLDMLPAQHEFDSATKQIATAVEGATSGVTAQMQSMRQIVEGRRAPRVDAPHPESGDR